jgi:hypothetical protein
MNQGSSLDPFGGTHDERSIDKLLAEHTKRWMDEAPRSGSPPNYPQRPSSAPGYSYNELTEIPGPKQELKRQNSLRFVSPELVEPYYVTNRGDSRLAFFDQSNEQESPEFAQSIIPIHPDPVEDYRWLVEHGAQIYDDPNSVEYVGLQEISRLRGRLFQDGLVVDLTRTDTVQPGRKTRWVVESFRDGYSRVDRYRGEHTDRSTRGQKPPSDFHRSYSIYEPAGEKSPVGSSTKAPVRSISGGSSHGSLASMLKNAVLGTEGKKSHHTSEPKAKQEGRGTRGEREEWIEQKTHRDDRGLLRRRVTRTDEGSVHWTTDDTPQSWKSDFKSSIKNCGD